MQVPAAAPSASDNNLSLGPEKDSDLRKIKAGFDQIGSLECLL
jgi:hypothetical protein